MVAGRYTLLQYPGKQAHFAGFELSLEGQRIDKAAGKQVAAEGRAAVDIKLYGSFEAHMYIEVKDGKVSVEPYDYIERDLEAAVPVDVALAIADGKTTIKEAVENGSLYVFGNVQFALKFAKLFD